MKRNDQAQAYDIAEEFACGIAYGFYDVEEGGEVPSECQDLIALISNELRGSEHFSEAALQLL